MGYDLDGGLCLDTVIQALILQCDHIIPAALGGGTSPDNLELLCDSCIRRTGATFGRLSGGRATQSARCGWLAVSGFQTSRCFWAPATTTSGRARRGPRRLVMRLGALAHRRVKSQADGRQTKCGTTTQQTIGTYRPLATRADSDGPDVARGVLAVVWASIPDLLGTIRTEIDGRLEELRPLAREASDLQQALDALTELASAPPTEQRGVKSREVV